jgi:phosphoribosyl 1,2-cyclic phosphate phosphodiesterase
MVISECTGGASSINYGSHMNLSNVCEFRKKAEEINLTDSETSWILTHFTHNNGTTYDEFKPIAEAENFQTAYDGMKLNLYF